MWKSSHLFIAVFSSCGGGEIPCRWECCIPQIKIQSGSICSPGNTQPHILFFACFLSVSGSVFSLHLASSSRRQSGSSTGTRLQERWRNLRQPCLFPSSHLVSSLSLSPPTKETGPTAIHVQAWTSRRWGPQLPPHTSLFQWWWKEQPGIGLFWSSFRLWRSLPWQWPCQSDKTKRVKWAGVLLISSECMSRC